MREQKSLAPDESVEKSAGHKPTRGKIDYNAQLADAIWEVTDKLPPVPEHTATPRDLAAAIPKAYDGVRRFGTKVYACRLSGIGRTVLNRMLKEDAVFRQGFKSAREEFYDTLETAMSLRGFVPRGDLPGIFILKHRRKAFSEVQRIELTGQGGGPVTYTDTVKAELLARLVTVKQRAGLEGKQEVVVNGKPQLMRGDGPKVRNAKA